MKFYCLSCSQPTVAELAIPKFCSHCGASFNNSTASVSPPKLSSLPKAIKATAPIVPKNVVEEDDDDDDDDTPVEVQVPGNFEGLEVEVEPPRKRGEKFSDIVATAPKEARMKKDGKFNQKKAFAEFQREASALKRS